MIETAHGKGNTGKGGCAICGSQGHWKNECPKNPDTAAPPGGRAYSLCALKEIPNDPEKAVTPTGNRFAELAEAPNNADHPPSLTDSEDEDEIRVPVSVGV